MIEHHSFELKFFFYLFSVLFPHSQPMLDGGKPAENRRWYSCTTCRYLFCILVLAAVLFVCSTNIEEMVPNWSPQWWMQYNTNQLWRPVKSRNHKTVPSESSEKESVTEMSAMIAGQRRGVTHSNNGPSPSVPYVSPGLYLVEYPYKYHFIINEPKKCEEQKPFLVLVVPVAPHNKAHRNIIRSTWGSESEALGKVVKLFFLLGLQTGESAQQLQEELMQESKEHQDLIQSDFLDCYKNLTIKTMVMLEWLDSYCSSASYAMKIDSDMFLNLPNLINMLLRAPRTNYMTGLVVRGAEVLRDRTSKWYIPEELYPNPHYPTYALGLGYILSLDLSRKMLEASRHLKALYIEDVYLGMCMEYLGIPPTDPPNWGYFHVFPMEYSRCAYSKLVATTADGTDRLSVWRDFKRTGRPC